MAVGTLQICDAVSVKLALKSAIANAHSADEMKESIAAGDMPLTQVYPETLDPNDDSGVQSFGGAIQRTRFGIIIDVYATPRKRIGQDMERLLPVIDAVHEVLQEQQKTRPPFGLDGIKAFAWTAGRVIFDYAGTRYMGFRFTLTIHVY